MDPPPHPPHPTPRLPCRASLARSSSCSFWASCTRSSVAESTLAEQPPWVSSRSLLSMSFICRSRLTSSCSWATSSRSRTATRKRALSKPVHSRQSGWHTGCGPDLQANTILLFLHRSTAWWIRNYTTVMWLAVAPNLPPKAADWISVSQKVLLPPNFGSEQHLSEVSHPQNDETEM